MRSATNIKRRSCDRCSKYKEKCEFKVHLQTCTRCEHFGLACTTVRMRSRPGRRPKIQSLGSRGSIQIWEIGSSSISAKTSQWLMESQQLPLAPSLGERGVLSSEPSSDASPFDNFPGIIHQFSRNFAEIMVGPSFAPRLRATAQHCYMCSPDLLRDIYTVISTAMHCGRQNICLRHQPDITRGTESVKRLRKAQVGRPSDAFAIIALGQALAAFELLTNCAFPMLILRYSLLSIRPWYGELSINPSLDAVTITPIFWDTVHCLVKREVPVIRFLPRDPHVVDHSAGLCSTLLPIFYDLCVASNIQKRGSESGEVDTDRLRQIEQMLLSWTPQPPLDFASSFSTREVLGMEAQASMYRAAGLLVTHRLLNPIGTLDGVARSYAEMVMLAFSEYSASVGPGTTMPYVAFPILMAAFEIQDIPNNIWDNISLLSVASMCAAKLSAIVAYIWRNRRSGYTGFMLELVDKGPEFIVVP